MDHYDRSGFPKDIFGYNLIHFSKAETELWESASAVIKESREAVQKFPPFNSAHEGFAVLKEEVDELWDEVKKRQGAQGQQGARDLDKMRKEAIQVAAMAIRFIVDVCNKETVQK